MYTRNTTQREDDSDPLRYTPDFFFFLVSSSRLRGALSIPKRWTAKPLNPHNLCFVNKFQCFTELFFRRFLSRSLVIIDNWLNFIYNSPSNNSLAHCCLQAKMQHKILSKSRVRFTQQKNYFLLLSSNTHSLDTEFLRRMKSELRNRENNISNVRKSSTTSTLRDGNSFSKKLFNELLLFAGA